MKHFLKIAEGVDVLPLRLALQMNPQLWNEHSGRKEFNGSSHKETSDIWVRYNDIKNIEQGYEAFTGPHDSVWYPSASILPIKPLVMSLMTRCEATRLGGVLITKIPAGGRVLPHTDSGWHPEHYPVKLYIPLQTNPQVLNRCEDEEVVMRTGDVWYFNNLVEHEVKNDGPDDRMTLIVCLRCD